MSVCFRILTLQSKRSQTSLQQILLHGEIDILKNHKPVCYGFSLRFVEAVLNSVIEKNDKARVLSGGLIAAMLSRGLLGEVKNGSLKLIGADFHLDCRDNSSLPWTAFSSLPRIC